MNSRDKGKVGEREFASLLRTQGFDARRGQQFAGSAESPDVISSALAWLHIEIKRVQKINLAEACAQAKRDAEGKPWIVAHRCNRAPWMITMDDRELYRLLRKAVPFLDLWPFAGPRPITMDAELFFQFLRTELPPPEARSSECGALSSTPHPDPRPDRGTKGDGAHGGPSRTGDPRPTNTISEVSSASLGTAGQSPALPENKTTEQTEQ